MTASTCPSCGRELTAHERDVRFSLPDPVLNLPEREETDGFWMSGPSASESVMMQVPSMGAFVRALLPVQLTGGYSVRFGVWVGVHPNDLQHAAKVWWKPEYAELRLSGRLANAVEPWGMLAAPVELAVLDPDVSPWCVGSSDELLSAVLGREWDHQLVLDQLPA
ncbi:DUF2199 domain-containing protein [Isoptericola sp. NPDC057391]|uniref:DUF2199 domain-containing protein n=1 Tax=Isoptericola sp. NPDC057391 TaxID=3346117 RepID=UPI00363FB27E